MTNRFSAGLFALSERYCQLFVAERADRGDWFHLARGLEIDVSLSHARVGCCEFSVRLFSPCAGDCSMSSPIFFIRRRVTPELSLSVINTRGARPRFMSGLRISRRDACRSRRPYKWRALNCRVHRTTKTDERASPSLAQVVLWIQARRLFRCKHDRPPGLTVMWRGFLPPRTPRNISDRGQRRIVTTGVRACIGASPRAAREGDLLGDRPNRLDLIVSVANSNIEHGVGKAGEPPRLPHIGLPPRRGNSSNRMQGGAWFIATKAACCTRAQGYALPGTGKPAFLIHRSTSLVCGWWALGASHVA